MAKKVTDSRIGIRDSSSYAITKRPTHYVNGRTFDSSSMTTYYFGDKKQYFVYLPSGMNSVPEHIMTSIKEILGLNEKAQEAPIEKVD